MHLSLFDRRTPRAAVCRRKRFELSKTGSYFLPLRRSAQSRFAGIIQFAHSVHELSPKHPAEHADRQEEAWPRYTACGRATTHRLEQCSLRAGDEQLLIPRIQDAEESDLRSENRVAPDRIDSHAEALANQAGAALGPFLERREFFPGAGVSAT